MSRCFTLMLMLAIASLHLTSCKNNNSQTTLPRPKEGEENEKNRERYWELLHKAAPGTDWKTIEQENLERNIQLRRSYLAARGSQTMAESFAGGLLQGSWEEKGSDNLAGNVRYVDYVPATDVLYVISDGGTLWKNPPTGEWIPLNKDVRCDPDILKVISKPSGGYRIITAFNNQIQYSDNEGQTFTASTGITFPVSWGGNYIQSIVTLNDANRTIYCITRPWSNSPWQPQFWLYRSVDQGQTFTKIYSFNHGEDGNISMLKPYNTENVYIADTRSNAGMMTLYSVSGSSVTQLNTATGTETNVKAVLKGTFVSGTLSLYLMLNNNKLYKSTNMGASWTSQSILPAAAWDRLEVSMDNPANVFFGGVEAYRSTTSGTSWTKVNGWAEYYSNTVSKLHADIMEITSFKGTDNVPFMIINTHGGTYISFDNMVTNTNIALSKQRVGQYYDVLTDPDNVNNLYVGSQDQGFQRNTSATTVGALSFTQVISGDYGHLALSGTAPNKHLWTQYPGGNIYYYANANGGLSTTWGPMPGTNIPNYGWMLPTTNLPTAGDHSILIGGGNISGGSGSYIIKLTPTLSNPYSISSSTYYNYDFRANSNNGTSGITALEPSVLNTNKMYVATEDGTFFYTHNAGGNWSKASSFSGPTPWYLYGSSILASRLTDNLVWYAGSGYSNSPVYKSTNGGASFTAINNGLPPTLVYEIVSNPTETMLFAATEAGPYVYVVANNQWYPMLGAENPLQAYTAVEYIASTNTVRFGTFGRGIWDFKISNPLPVNLISFQANKQDKNIQCQWQTAQEFNTSYFNVQKSNDGTTFNNIGKVTAAGNSSVTRSYSFADVNALDTRSPILYYRLQMMDNDGKHSYSNIVPVRLTAKKEYISIAPNPVHSVLNIVVGAAENSKAMLIISDAKGTVVKRESINLTTGTLSKTFDVSAWSKGMYIVNITSNKIKLQEKFVIN